MKRLLIILFLLSVFLFYSYAGVEKDKTKPIFFDQTIIYDFPLWLFNQGYVPFYDSNWSARRGHGVIVLQRPPTFWESFFDGVSKGMSRSLDYFYRKKEQEQYTKTMMGLLELKWASESKSKPNSYKNYQGWKFYLRDSHEPPPVSKEEIETHRKRIKELDKKIEKRLKLNEYLKSLNLPPIPDDISLDGFEFHCRDKVIYWDGEKWAKKKKDE